MSLPHKKDFDGLDDENKVCQGLDAIGLIETNSLVTAQTILARSIGVRMPP